MDISIIIVSWNTREILRECLKSVYEQAGNVNFEVIVVDNASKDGSCEMVRQFFPEAKLIVNSTNRGYAGAVNKGLRIAISRYVLVLNSDILICDSAIEKTVDYADKHPRVAVVGCKVLDDNGEVHITCRCFPSLLNLLLDTLGLNRIFRYNKILGGEYMWWWPRDSEREVDVVSGMFMLVRRQAIEEVGLMDEDFFFLFEETDWCYRFSKAGWKMLFWPGAKVIHVHGGGQSRKIAGVKIAMQYQKSMLIFFRKHYGRGECLRARILLIIRSIFSFLVWGILGLYRKLAGRDAQYEDNKVRLYWWSFWFCLLGIEPDKGGLKQFVRKNADNIKNGIEISFAILYRMYSRLFYRPPAKVVLYYHAMKQKDIEDFEGQMKYLAKFCQVVKASDVMTTSQDGSKPMVAIIFDDAFVSFRDNALPVLRRYGLPAAVAVPVGVMGKSPDWQMGDNNEDSDEVVLDAKAITELDRQGCEIMSHTVSHRNLTKISNADLKTEFCESKHTLEKFLGHEVDCITYPYGDCSAAVCEAAVNAGYRLGFSIEPQTVGQSRDSLCIGRFRVSPDESMLSFKLKAQGAYRVASFFRFLKRVLTGQRQGL